MPLTLHSPYAESAIPMRDDEILALDIINSTTITPGISPKNVNEAKEQCYLILDKLMSKARKLAKNRDHFLDIAYCILTEFYNRQKNLASRQGASRNSATILMLMTTSFYWQNLLKNEGKSEFHEAYTIMKNSQGEVIPDIITLVDVVVVPEGLPLQDEAEQLQKTLASLPVEQRLELETKVCRDNPTLMESLELLREIKFALADIRSRYHMQAITQSELQLISTFKFNK